MQHCCTVGFTLFLIKSPKYGYLEMKLHVSICNIYCNLHTSYLHSKSLPMSSSKVAPRTFYENCFVRRYPVQTCVYVLYWYKSNSSMLLVVVGINKIPLPNRDMSTFIKRYTVLRIWYYVQLNTHQNGSLPKYCIPFTPKLAHLHKATIMFHIRVHKLHTLHYNKGSMYLRSKTFLSPGPVVLMVQKAIQLNNKNVPDTEIDDAHDIVPEHHNEQSGMESTSTSYPTMSGSIHALSILIHQE